jgi:hypothetical protein
MTHRNASRERGTAWERRVADYFAARGLPWDRAPLRGTGDLLDIAGCLPMGWLVGCKARGPGKPVRLNEAMDEAAAAVNRVPDGFDGVIGVQVVQRPQHSVGDAYVVMTADDFTDLVLERWAWQKGSGRRGELREKLQALLNGDETS